MTKTYTVAGLATDKNGNTKVRYANNLDKRLKVLLRDGFTNLNFIHSDTPKTKEVLCGMMIGLIQYQNDRQIILDEMKNITSKNTKLHRKQVLVVGTFSC